MGQLLLLYTTSQTQHPHVHLVGARCIIPAIVLANLVVVVYFVADCTFVAGSWTFLFA